MLSPTFTLARRAWSCRVRLTRQYRAQCLNGASAASRRGLKVALPYDKQKRSPQAFGRIVAREPGGTEPYCKGS